MRKMPASSFSKILSFKHNGQDHQATVYVDHLVEYSNHSTDNIVQFNPPVKGKKGKIQQVTVCKGFMRNVTVEDILFEIKKLG